MSSTMARVKVSPKDDPKATANMRAGMSVASLGETISKYLVRHGALD